MALRSTVYRADLTVSDLDRGVYAQHALTLARHPSETEERMMVRLLAFALHADEALVFGRGLSTEDEADLWQRDPTGVIERWIDVGLPDEREVRRACGRSREVVVLAYGGRRAAPWWSANAAALARLPNLRVLALDDDACTGLASLAARSMQLTATVHDGHVWLASASASVEIVPRQWLPAP
jgi:uncharacterized protein YaeQ